MLFSDGQVEVRMICLLAGKMPKIARKAFLTVMVKELCPTEEGQIALLGAARTMAEDELSRSLPFEKVRP